MANTTTSSVDDLLPSIVAEAMFQAQEQSIMRNLVKNYAMPMGSGKTLTVAKYANATAVDLTEGTDLTASEVTTSGAVLTIKEAGIMGTVTDLAVRTASANVIADMGALFGRAVAKKIDADLVALFAGFSNTLGDGVANMTAADIFAAVATLRNAEVPSTDLFCVVNPLIAYDLKANMTNSFANSNANDLANEALRSGYVGTIAGVRVFEHAAVSGNGAVFHRDALALATMADIAIETQRDASLRATELVATATYAVGELFDTYGVGLDYASSL